MTYKPNRKILLIILIATVILLFIIIGAIDQNKPAQPTPTVAATSTPPPITNPPETPPPETPQPTEEPTAEPVLVATAQYQLTYSGSMADYITYNELPETPLTDLAFHVNLGTRSEKIYTLVLNSEEGEIVNMIQTASGETIPVAFIMDELPPNLSPEETDLFCTAQETVNEVIESLIVK